jgi:hypothetical protein
VSLEDEDSHPESFTTTDTSVRAVLVYRKGADGAVRVTSSETQDFWNVRTGPKEEGWAIIGVKVPEQTCMFLGKPKVRLFKALES